MEYIIKKLKKKRESSDMKPKPISSTEASFAEENWVLTPCSLAIIFSLPFCVYLS